MVDMAHQPRITIALTHCHIIRLLLVAGVLALHLHHNESVDQQGDDQRVLAGEEHVGVAEHSIVEDEQ